MPRHDDYDPEKPSKTVRKNEMLALQKLGETLVGLSETQLKKMPLEENLLEAIYFARTMKSHESIRRQLQYIGKLMREIDCDEIKAELSKIKMSNEKSTTQFHKLEQWRDQLIAHGDTALQKFMELYPDADKQVLRQMIRKAQTDQKQNVNSGGASQLFKYLRTIFGG